MEANTVLEGQPPKETVVLKKIKLVISDLHLGHWWTRPVPTRKGVIRGYFSYY